MMNETVAKITVYGRREDAAEALEKISNPNYTPIHKEAANNHRQSAEESFQRCDTDGFVSQWASRLTGQKEDLEDELNKRSGIWMFRVLVDLDGNLVSTKLFSFTNKFAKWKVSNSWLIPNAYDPKGRGTWINDGLKPETLTGKGYMIGWMLAPAFVATRGPLDRTPEKYGMSNAVNVRYCIYRDHEKEGLDR